MKLRNKKTGEIYEMWSESANLGEPSVIALFPRGQVHPDNKIYKYNSLAELNEEWEDAPEEPKGYWYIDCAAPYPVDFCEFNEDTEDDKAIGNYFGTKEEAEKAVEKLKAWKRLKDKGFRFKKWDYRNGMHIDFEFTKQAWASEIKSDLDLLFGGEE